MKTCPKCRSTMTKKSTNIKDAQGRIIKTTYYRCPACGHTITE